MPNFRSQYLKTSTYLSVLRGESVLASLISLCAFPRTSHTVCGLQMERADSSPENSFLAMWQKIFDKMPNNFVIFQAHFHIYMQQLAKLLPKPVV